MTKFEIRWLVHVWIILLGALLWVGCPQDDDDATGDDDDSADDDDTTGDACVETAAGTFPADADELAHTTEGGTSNILATSWNAITGYEGSYTIGEERMWEGVRFDLLAPAPGSCGDPWRARVSGR